MKASEHSPFAHYHCHSRVVDRRFVFGPEEREMFVKMMRDYEVFCGVPVLTYQILSNHFHVVLEVPQRPTVLPTDQELLQRLGRISERDAAECRRLLEMLHAAQDHPAVQALRERYFKRMWNLSSFMKELKQRFTQWYNKTHDRTGTLWEGRFKSHLMQAKASGLPMAGSYVDMNCVRADITFDPANYRWGGYAEAMAGQLPALLGLRLLMARSQNVPPETLTLEESLASYRLWMFAQGEENEGTDETGKPLRRGFSREQVLKVLQDGGRVGWHEFIRVKVRYFTDGQVLGTKQFVDEIFAQNRQRFGPKRQTGARRVKGLTGHDLYSLRDLRVRVFE